MNPQEWMDIAATIQARWPSVDLPISTLEQWGRDLEDLPGDQVAATVETLHRDGREFAPNSGVIRKRHAELMLDPPDWGEVLEQLRVIEMAPESKVARILNEDDMDKELEAEIAYPREEVLARAHPMVVAFREYLGTQVRDGVGVSETRALMADGGNEARLREKWVAFRATAEKRVSYIGIEPSGLPALERQNRGNRQLRQAGSVFADVRDQVARPELTEKASDAG